MIAVAPDHAGDTVHARAFPDGIAARNGGFRGLHITGNGPAAVGLKVRLVDQVQAVFIAQFVESRLIRVVGGANSVDIVALAGDDVGEHLLLGDGTAQTRVELVAVGAAEDDALAVESHNAVNDFEMAEAETLRHHFDDAVVCCAHGESQRVQVGLFGAPWTNVGQIRAELHGGAVDRGVCGAAAGYAGGVDDVGHGIGILPDRRAVGIHECGAELLGVGDVADHGMGVDGAGMGGRLEIGGDVQVFDVHSGLRGEFNGAEQTVHAPKVLIFQPTCGGVFIAGHGQCIGSGNQCLGDVEFAGCVGVLGVADEGTVEPDVDGGGGAVEGQRDAALVFDGGGDGGACLESAAVNGYVTISGDVGSLGVAVAIPGVLHVDVLMVQQALGFQC